MTHREECDKHGPYPCDCKPKSGWSWAIIMILVAVIVAGLSFGADLLRSLQEAFLR